jgi:hypothetical protein
MADDKTLRGPRDRSRIALGEDYELRYWTGKFGVSEERLRETVAKVGHDPDAVWAELRSL